MQYLHGRALREFLIFIKIAIATQLFIQPIVTLLSWFESQGNACCAEVTGLYLLLWVLTVWLVAVTTTGAMKETELRFKVHLLVVLQHRAAQWKSSCNPLRSTHTEHTHLKIQTHTVTYILYKEWFCNVQNQHNTKIHVNYWWWKLTLISPPPFA